MQSLISISSIPQWWHREEWQERKSILFIGRSGANKSNIVRKNTNHTIIVDSSTVVLYDGGMWYVVWGTNNIHYKDHHSMIFTTSTSYFEVAKSFTSAPLAVKLAGWVHSYSTGTSSA